MKPLKDLFDVILALYPKKLDAYVAIGEVVSASPDTVRKWVHNRYGLSYVHAFKLIEHFNLNPSDYLQAREGFVFFNDLCPRSNFVGQVLCHAEFFASQLEQSTVRKIYVKARELPFFHLFGSRRLTYFKIYACLYEFEPLGVSFEAFLEAHDWTAYDAVVDRIRTAYQRIPSDEIWDDIILDNLLSDIGFINDLHCFDDPNTRLLLLNDLEQVVKRFKEAATLGYKEVGVGFNFYKKNKNIEQGTLSIEGGEKSTLIMALGGMHNMTTRDRHFIEVQERAFRTALARSTGIGLEGMREREIYFNFLRKKIDKARSGK